MARHGSCGAAIWNRRCSLERLTPMAHGDQTIQLELDRALALVLFEFLARTLDENDAEALKSLILERRQA